MQLTPGDILKKAREKKKLTQESLAAKIGITLRQYHKYESGHFPKYKSENIKEIDSLLGTNIFELIYEQKEALHELNRFNINKELFQELTKDVREIKATVYILKATVAQLAANAAGKAIGTMLVEIERAIAEKADSLFDEDKKNQSLTS